MRYLILSAVLTKINDVKRFHWKQVPREEKNIKMDDFELEKLRNEIQQEKQMK